METVHSGDNWRVSIKEDDDMYDDSYIDTWGESEEEVIRLKKELWDRIENEGVWGLVGEVKCKCCGSWTTTDSVWGFVGDDWKNSGYDDYIIKTTKKQAEIKNA